VIQIWDEEPTHSHRHVHRTSPRPGGVILIHQHDHRATTSTDHHGRQHPEQVRNTPYLSPDEEQA
jgi:hypothetical protein